MVDYPYPTNFLNPLPAWPISYACQQAKAASEDHAEDDYAKVYPIAAAGKTFYNYNEWQTCFDIFGPSDSGLDDSGWSVQACNEMVMPFASDPETSMFPPSAWDEKSNTAYCQSAFGLTP